MKSDTQKVYEALRVTMSSQVLAVGYTSKYVAVKVGDKLYHLTLT
jgi:hypothetical protein